MFIHFQDASEEAVTLHPNPSPALPQQRGSDSTGRDSSSFSPGRLVHRPGRAQWRSVPLPLTFFTGLPFPAPRARRSTQPQPLCTPVQMAYAPSLAKRAAALEAVAAHLLLPRSYLVCDKHFSVDFRSVPRLPPANTSSSIRLRARRTNELGKQWQNMKQAVEALFRLIPRVHFMFFLRKSTEKCLSQTR